MRASLSGSRSCSVSGSEDSLAVQEQNGDLGDQVGEARSRAGIFLRSLATCLAGTTVVVGVPAFIANAGIVGCGVGFVLNEFNCSTEAGLGLVSVGVTTGLICTGAYILQMQLLNRLAEQQQPQDASADSDGGAGPASASSRQSDTALSVDLSLPPQEREGKELDP